MGAVDYKWHPEPELAVGCRYPKKMTPSEMVAELGNGAGVRELMLIEKRDGYTHLMLGAVEVARIYTNIEPEGYGEALAESFAGAGRMIDDMRRLLEDVLYVHDNHPEIADCPDCKSTLTEIRELLGKEA